jgi:uncharacterized protein
LPSRRSNTADSTIKEYHDRETSIRLVTNAANKRNRLNNPTLIAGFPGAGLVGSMSANYITEQQKMHQICFVESEFIVPGTIYIGGKLRHPFRIYSNEKGNACTMICDAPVRMSGIYYLLNSVMNWCKINTVKEVIVLEGIPARDLNALDSDRDRVPIILSSDGKPDDFGYLDHMGGGQDQGKGQKDQPGMVEPELIKPFLPRDGFAFIPGMAEGLLASCLSNGIPCTGIFVQSFPSVPDPEGSVVLIETANKITSNLFQINTDQLRNQAAMLKRQLQGLADSVIQQQENDKQSPLGTKAGIA